MKVYFVEKKNGKVSYVCWTCAKSYHGVFDAVKLEEPTERVCSYCGRRLQTEKGEEEGGEAS